MQLMAHETEPAIRELLCDLGWLPADLQCEDKKRLAEEYLNATIAWFDMGKGLQRTILERLRQGYEGLSNDVREYEALAPSIEEARLKAAQARLALRTHMDAHNC